jgi:hypothetical protein
MSSSSTCALVSKNKVTGAEAATWTDSRRRKRERHVDNIRKRDRHVDNIRKRERHVDNIRKRERHVDNIRKRERHVDKISGRRSMKRLGLGGCGVGCYTVQAQAVVVRRWQLEGDEAGGERR